MPRRDGTGPMRIGAMTGRGLGVCTGANAVKDVSSIGFGLGFGYRRGLGRNYVADQTVSKTQKELLQEQKELLKNRLQVIEKQLEE